MTLRAKIESFGKLQVGWHYGEGGPASAETIARALVVGEGLAETMADVDAFPAIDGAILIRAYGPGFDLEVILEIDGSVLWTMETGDGSSYTERITYAQTQERMGGGSVKTE